MKQILIDRYGPPEEVARCAQVPDVGAPAAGEVVFDVLAFPINPADVSFCRGTYRLKPPLPATPGAECVGRVTAVGAGVSDVRPGDLVINSHGGPDMAPIPPTFGTPRHSRGAPRSSAQWDDRVVARLVADHARDVPLARQVLRENDVARMHARLRPVTDFDLGRP